MKNSKWIIILLVLAMMLSTVSGCSAEQENESEGSTVPGMDVAVDEVLGENEERSDEDNDDGPAGVQIPFALSLDTTTASLDYSQRVTLTASASIGAGSIQWACSDEDVASISRTTGDSVTVTALNEGTATVTCSLGGASQSCEVTVKPAQTLQITGVDYPATLLVGKSWKLGNGTVASTENLTSLTSVIKDADGIELTPSHTETFSGDVKRFDINGIDAYVPFSRITNAGSYTWTLSAVDGSGRTVSLDMSISAVSEGESVVETEPGVYAPAANSDENEAEETGLTSDTTLPETEAPDQEPEGDHSNDSAEVSDSVITSSAHIHMVSDITDLQVGGRNYFSYYKIALGSFGGGTFTKSSDYSYTCVTTEDTEALSDINLKGPSGVRFNFTGSIPLSEGPHIFSFDASASAECNVAFDYCDAQNPENDEMNRTGYALSATPVRVVLYKSDSNHTAPDYAVPNAIWLDMFSRTIVPAGTTITLSHFKLERGTIATDWTPAPEDVEARTSAGTIDIPVPSEGWTVDAANHNLCHIDIPAAGLSSTSNTACIASLVQTGAESTDAPAREAFALLTRGVVGDGKVTLYALQPPTTALTLHLVTIATNAPVTEIIGLTNGF